MERRGIDCGSGLLGADGESGQRKWEEEGREKHAGCAGEILRVMVCSGRRESPALCTPPSTPESPAVFAVFAAPLISG